MFHRANPTWGNMKKLICMLALLPGSSAHAQVYFEPGSARAVSYNRRFPAPL
jgi:hypothetical protein